MLQMFPLSNYHSSLISIDCKTHKCRFVCVTNLANHNKVSFKRNVILVGLITGNRWKQWKPRVGSLNHLEFWPINFVVFPGRI